MSKLTAKFTATPTKLRDDTWGARVDGAAQVGDIITVNARSGKSWDCEVDYIVWSGADRATGNPIALVRTRSIDGSRRAAAPAQRRPASTPARSTGRRSKATPAPHWATQAAPARTVDLEPSTDDNCRAMGCHAAADDDGLCPLHADIRDTIREFESSAPSFTGDERDEVLVDSPADEPAPECVWSDDDFAGAPVAAGEGW